MVFFFQPQGSISPCTFAVAMILIKFSANEKMKSKTVDIKYLIILLSNLSILITQHNKTNILNNTF